ncbi:transposase [Bradyrhizobium sp. CCBAU 11445]|uniref:transposase n=1 Tax=Bradyrhizobium sp. CCBAU 11445 TaxID=1630896 RepID=UPI003FA4B561
MIDSSVVRVHQHASGVKNECRSLCGPKPRRPHHENPRARRRERPPGPPHDHPWRGPRREAEALLDGLDARAVIIADKGYDADRVRAHIRDQGAIPNIPNKSNRKKRFRWKKAIYRERNHAERFFNKLKQLRRIASRYDKLGATFFAFVQLASVRIWLRSIESTPSLLCQIVDFAAIYRIPESIFQ